MVLDQTRRIKEVNIARLCKWMQTFGKEISGLRVVDVILSIQLDKWFPSSFLGCWNLDPRLRRGDWEITILVEMVQVLASVTVSGREDLG